MKTRSCEKKLEMLCSHFGYMIKSTQVKDHGHVLLTLEHKL